jgi:hypothetical protein
VTGHAENEKYGLSSAAELSSHSGHAKRLEEYFESIGHVVNLGVLYQSSKNSRRQWGTYPGISFFELTNNIS